MNNEPDIKELEYEPNRYFVTKEYLDLLEGLKRGGTAPGTATTKEVSEVDLTNEQLKKYEDYFREIIDKNYKEQTLTAVEGLIQAKFVDQKVDEYIEVKDNGLEVYVERLEKLSSEVNILKDEINSKVSSTELEEMTVLNDSQTNSVANLMSKQSKILAEKITHTESQVTQLKEEIELKVGEFDASQMFVTGSNDTKTSLWANSFGTSHATLNNFSFDSTNQWVGDGTEQDPYALRFGAGQSLTIDNPLYSQTPSTQRFTIEAFLKLRNASIQTLADIGNGIFLCDGEDSPSIILNNTVGQEYSFTSDYAIPTNEIVHLVFRVNVQTRLMDIIINNTSMPGIHKFNGLPINMKQTLTLMNGFNGELYLLRIYETSINNERVAQNYVAGITGNNYSRDDLKVLLDARKVEHINSRVTSVYSEISVLKNLITLSVTREEYDAYKNNTRNELDDLNGDLSLIEQRIQEAELKITPESITATVENTSTVIATKSYVNEAVIDRVSTEVPKVIEEVSPYVVEVISTRGNIFKNGAISTTLMARVYKNKTDVTDTIDANRFKWTRISDDTEEDNRWNQSNFGGKKQIAVTSNDVRVRATFVCELLD